MAETANQKADQPTFEVEAYKRQRVRWDLIEDVLGGTDTMRAKAATYLPQAPAEAPEDYSRRVAVADFFNGFELTVVGLTGRVFRKDIVLSDDTPEVLVEHWENIDGEGTHGDVFARDAFEGGLGKGHTLILVDAPATDGDLNAEEEQLLQVRPYWVLLQPEQVVSWRTERIGGVTVLSQLVVREGSREPTGQFGETEVIRYRRWVRESSPEDGGGRVRWELWGQGEITSKDKKFAKIEEGVVANVTEIPLAVGYAGRKLGVLETKPPLLDLAYTNVAHYQVRSDHRYSLHVASVPVPVFTGLPEEGDLPFGSGTGIRLPEGGTATYMEHSGSALTATRNELQDLLALMATQGLSMLQRETRAAETAESKHIDQNQQDSKLAAAARGLKDALEQAFAFHAQMIGVEPGSVEVNTDFDDLSMGTEELKFFREMVAAEQLSIETLWEIIQTGKFPEDFDGERERQRIAERALDADRGEADQLQEPDDDDEKDPDEMDDAA